MLRWSQIPTHNHSVEFKSFISKQQLKYLMDSIHIWYVNVPSLTPYNDIMVY